MFTCWPACYRPGSGTTDVMFVRSTDGGQTFSAPHRINDDPKRLKVSGTGLAHFAVAPNGRH